MSDIEVVKKKADSYVRISVIITCYNLEKEITRAVESVENQTLKPYEVIIVDDGSQDSSREVLNELSKQYDNLVLVFQNNSGPSAARNKGIDKASGEYLMFLDGDDYIEKNYLSDCANGLSEDVDIVIAGMTYIYSNGERKVIRMTPFCLDHYEFVKNKYSECVSTRLVFGPVNKLYSRNLIEENSIRFDEKLKIREDCVFVLDCIKKAQKLSCIENPGYYYIQHDLGSSLVTKFNEDEYTINEKFYLDMRSMLDNSLSKKDICNINPIYLNMQISTIRKYYCARRPSIGEGRKYIRSVLSNEVYKNSRKELLSVNLKLAMKYYRPIWLFEIINRIKAFSH